jgi:hypothetical protein
MAKYSIFINRVKCLETTSGPGADEVYCVKFTMYYKKVLANEAEVQQGKPPKYEIVSETRISEPFEIGNFSSGESIWLPDGKKYLHEAKPIDDLRYTLFYILLFEKDDTALQAYEISKADFKTWFLGRLNYYNERYDWNRPELWREKLISATYNRIDYYFDSPAVSGVNDDERIGRKRVVVDRGDLDYVWDSKPGTRKEKNYTFQGDGGKYRAEIFVYGYHG